MTVHFKFRISQHPYTWPSHQVSLKWLSGGNYDWRTWMQLGNLDVSLTWGEAKSGVGAQWTDPNEKIYYEMKR